MKTLPKSRIILGVTAVVALTLAVVIVGGLAFTTAFAQGGTLPNVSNDQAVLDLLRAPKKDLYQLRQSGKSWLDIAASRGVTETALLDALLKPVEERHAWMSQTYPQFNAEQMEQAMRAQFTNDLRQTQYGTMTDMHIFGGGGMMGSGNNPNGFGGMMQGRGMMGNWNNEKSNDFRGMMRGGGMMHGWNAAPNATPAPTE